MHPSVFNGYETRKIVSSPFPNKLLEASLRLPETQLKIVCYTVRWTVGYASKTPGVRRSSTLVSLHQVQQQVGRASSKPIAEALAALVDAGILTLSDTNGEPIAIRALIADPNRRFVLRLSPAWVIG